MAMTQNDEDRLRELIECTVQARVDSQLAIRAEEEARNRMQAP